MIASVELKNQTTLLLTKTYRLEHVGSKTIFPEITRHEEPAEIVPRADGAEPALEADVLSLAIGGTDGVEAGDGG